MKVVLIESNGSPIRERQKGKWYKDIDYPRVFFYENDGTIIVHSTENHRPVYSIHPTHEQYNQWLKFLVLPFKGQIKIDCDG